jgi:nitroreductase
MSRAPLLVVVLSCKDAYLDRYAEPDKGWTDRDEARWPVPYWHVDVGMAALLMLQTAVDEGLAASFFGIGAGEIAGFRAAFGVPDEWAPTGVIAVGHAADGGAPGSPSRRRRRPLDDVVHRGRW